jgi:branched-chain amino acid transport system substrate-binding protein
MRTAGTISALVRISGLPWTRTAAASTLALAALALAGCLGGEERSTRIGGDTVVVYSSLPHHGVSVPAARAAAAGERLALDEAGGEAGGLKVKLVQLSSTEDDERLWDPDLISANADRAADDPKAIAYIGELDYGGSAVSLPITNDAELLQVSPTDSLTSLTQRTPGRPRAGPERYYPTKQRSFARLVPNDDLLAETLLELARTDGARRLGVLFDGEIYGRELAGELAALGRRDGPDPVAIEEYRGRVEEIPDVVRNLADADPNVVAYAGIANPDTARLLAGIRERLPGVPVYASAGLLARDPRRPIPAAPDEVQVVAAVAPAREMPASGRRLLARLRRHTGRDVARPEALYGYEAMRVVLDAIRAGGPDRERVRRAALRTRVRRSPMGDFLLRATGDVDNQRFGVWSLTAGRFEFDRMVGDAPSCSNCPGGSAN